MASTFEPTRTLSALGQWVEDFYHHAFFQPNNEVSASTLNESFAQGFSATINHDQISRKDFIEGTAKFRELNVSSAQSIKEIQSWDAPDGSGGGCVALLLQFEDTNKKTGVSAETSTLLVANVQVIGGKRKLVALTEVLKPLK